MFSVKLRSHAHSALLCISRGWGNRAPATYKGLELVLRQEYAAKSAGFRLDNRFRASSFYTRSGSEAIPRKLPCLIVAAPAPAPAGR